MRVPNGSGEWAYGCHHFLPNHDCGLRSGHRAGPHLPTFTIRCTRDAPDITARRMYGLATGAVHLMPREWVNSVALVLPLWAGALVVLPSSARDGLSHVQPASRRARAQSPLAAARDVQSVNQYVSRRATSVLATAREAGRASAALTASTTQQSTVPEWARQQWETFSKIRSLELSLHVKPSVLTGHFYGDGKPDVALLVQHRTTRKVGIVFIHPKNSALVRVVGAGTDFGNGGDNFDWMDSWKLQPRTRSRPVDAVVVERESSASGLVYFAGGKYHWKQVGD